MRAVLRRTARPPRAWVRSSSICGGALGPARFGPRNEPPPPLPPPAPPPPGAVAAAAFALNKRIVASRSFGDVLELFDRHGNEFTEVNLASAVNRLAKLSSFMPPAEKVDSRLERLVLRAAAAVAGWRPRHLAIVCWGVAKIGGVAGAKALFDAVAKEAPRQIGGFTAQNLANTVWAYATVGFEAPALLEAVALESENKIATFDAQNLANTAWAYATAGVEAPALFEAIAVQVEKKIETFTPQNLANTAWAFAKAAFEAPVLFEAVGEEAAKKIKTFYTPELAITVWAFAKAGVSAPLLFEAVAQEAAKQVEACDTQSLEHLVWAQNPAPPNRHGIRGALFPPQQEPWYLW